MVEDYERRIRELEALKTQEFNTMQGELQAKIDDLIE